VPKKNEIRETYKTGNMLQWQFSQEQVLVVQDFNGLVCSHSDLTSSDTVLRPIRLSVVKVQVGIL